MFVERKIIGRMYGEKHRQFGMINGWNALYEAVSRLCICLLFQVCVSFIGVYFMDMYL